MLPKHGKGSNAILSLANTSVEFCFHSAPYLLVRVSMGEQAKSCQQTALTGRAVCVPAHAISGLFGLGQAGVPRGAPGLYPTGRLQRESAALFSAWSHLA